MDSGQTSQGREPPAPGRAVGVEAQMNLNSLNDDIDLARKLPARARLHEICAGYKWKQPAYECCKEEGVSRSKLFTFKVVVEIIDIKGTTAVLECFGAPRPKKKAAADDAAEGVLWYLEQCGFIPNTKRTHGDESEEGAKRKKPKKTARCTADLQNNTSQTATAY